MNKSIFFSILIILIRNVWSTTLERVDPIIMPGIPPKNINEDDYLCTAFKTNSKEAEYVTEFKPNASNPSILHHILIFGCETPEDPKGATKNYVWKCSKAVYHNCGPGRARILYSWARNAPSFTMPKGTGFKVGGQTKLKYLILHVHYIKVSQITSPEDSGFFLKMVPQSAKTVTKSAGIMWLKSDFEQNKAAVIKAHSYLNFENACPMNASKTMYPIAIRPNSNARGIVVSGWIIHTINDYATWTLIGRYSPNPKQAFYHVKQNYVITRTDWLAMRCRYRNDNDFDIQFGINNANETCNIYVIYYVEGDDNESLTGNKICKSFGPPYYTWKSDPNLPGARVPDWVDKAADRLEFDN